MGKLLNVVDCSAPADAVVRLIVDRSLTGMGHETYDSPAACADSGRTSDLLAAKLFDTGTVARVHVFSNVVTVTLRPDSGASPESFREAVEGLFTYYLPGVKPSVV